MTRVGFAILCWVGIFLLAIIAGVEIFGSLFFGFVLWAGLMAFLVRPFLVSVPEVTGLVTINLLVKIRGETYYCYPTGIHFRFPWEQVKEGNYINLRTITQQRKENYPSADGPAMVVKWSFQYIPQLDLLPRFIAVDETTINDGIADVGSSFLSVAIAQRDAIKCKEQQEDLENGLKNAFEGSFRKGTAGETVEQFYGIDIVRISLADVDYDEKFQRARTSEQVAERLKGIAASLKKGNITEKEALSSAMIINGDIQKAIQEQEITGEGAMAVASFLMAMANAMGGSSSTKKGGK